MSQIESRQGGQFPQRLNFKLSKFYRRQEISTPADKLSTKSCGHSRAPVRNVVELDGPATYICRDCFAYLRAIETRAVVRRQLATLFGRPWPPGFNPEAALPAGRGATYG
jgi:hypothetical protein